jgi:fructose-1-phosphate kinase PfkB-like protein
MQQIYPTTDQLSELCYLLSYPKETPKAFIGFDGFIDEIIYVVDKRISPDTYERINFIPDYAERIARGSGMSTNIEYVSQQIKMGGNGPLLAAALLNYSVKVTYIGAVGFPDLNPVLYNLKQCNEVICLSPPAVTEALEFNDGKIITSKLSTLNEVTWENIVKCCTMPRLIEIFKECSYYVFSNWSMILGMNHIWEEFLNQITPNISTSSKTVFFDLADPEKRTKEDLKTGLSLIKDFTNAGFRVILSMNLKEACEISEVLGETITDYRNADTRVILHNLLHWSDLYCTVIHLMDRACCQHSNNYFEVNGPYCATPKLTTGAGDNFNAGFLYGIMQNYSFTDCLSLGCATSGFYVRNAKSPLLREVIEFIHLWEKNPTLK